MALRASVLYQHVKHRLGNELEGFSSESLVNQAGEWLFSAHGWKFLARPPARLSLRGTITFTAATWTESTKTLAITAPASALADYVLLDGDQVEITGGTGADLGFYDVLSNTSANAVLRTSIGSAANGSTNITGQLELAGLRLPSDCIELAGVPCGSVGRHSIYPTTMQTLINARDTGTAPTGGDYYGAIVFGNSVGTDGGAPVPRLELYPAPAADDLNSVTIYYRAGWVPLTSEQQYSATPVWFDPLLIQAVRAYSSGIDKDNMAATLAEVRMSALFLAAQQRDGTMQRRYGPIRGSKIHRALGQLGQESVSLTFDYP